MIDFHTHLLPELDDGASSAEVSKQMLEQSKEQGVTTVLLTSHYYGKRRSPARFLKERAEALERLKAVAPEGVSFVLAAEVHFTGELVPSFSDLAKLKIADTDYILLEFPFVTRWRTGLLERVKAFAGETGLIPIIAHAERYEIFYKDPKLLAQFVAAGCLVQVNAEAFLNKETKGLAFAMLRHGLVHCIGSDMHDLENRPQNLAAAKEALKAAGEGAAFEKMQRTMEKILANQSVRVEFSPVKKLFGKFF